MVDSSIDTEYYLIWLESKCSKLKYIFSRNLISEFEQNKTLEKLNNWEKSS